MTHSTIKGIKRAALSFFIIATLLVAIVLVGSVAYADNEPYIFDDTTGKLTFNTNEAVSAWAGTEIDSASIKELVFGENVTLIPDGKFRNLSAVESITFLGDITVNGGAFYNTIALDSVTFNGDAILNSGSFTSSPYITKVSFAGKSEINGGVFSSSSQIESLTFADSVKLMSGGLFSGLSNLKSITFPAGSVISQGTFNSTGLERIVFEGDIEVSASFSGSTSLKYVEFKGESKLSNGAFSSAPIETLIFGGKTELGAGALAAASLKVTSLTFPAGSTFASGSIYNLPTLTDLTFLGDVDLAAGGVFSTTTALERVTFMGTSNINNGAFTNTPKIAEITFVGATSVSSGAFSGSSSLKSLTFPAGSTFGAGVFYNLSALEALTFEGDFDLGGNAGSFYILPALKTLTFGGAVKSSYEAIFCTSFIPGDDDYPVIERNDDLTIIFLRKTPDITPAFFSVMSEDIDILLPCNVDLEAYLHDLEDRGYTSLMDNVTVAEHVWNDGEITTPATCSAVGVKTFTCSLDSAHTRTEDVVIVADAHTWNDGEITTPATCSAVGVKTFTCTHNSEHTRTEDVAIVADAHSFGDWKAEIPATTENAGTKAHKTCSLCQKHFDANGNEITDLAIAKLTPTTPEPENTPEEENNKTVNIVIGATSGTVALTTLAGVLIKKKKIRFLKQFME